MTKHAAAYIRRSHATKASPGDASKTVQQEATHRLAAQHCEGIPVEDYVDWGISGRNNDRPEYVRLKADIAAGEVTCVTAYSLSRLGRTARELDDFLTLAEKNNVTVATDKDGVLTATSANSRFMRRLLAELAELESELTRERIADTMAKRKARGDAFGNTPLGFTEGRDSNGARIFVPDGSADVVIKAYQEAGTRAGAARLLSERGVLPPREQQRKKRAEEAGETYVPQPGAVWSTTVVDKMLNRIAPELLPPKRVGGQRRSSKSLLGQLVRCHCGATMTPDLNRGNWQLACWRGRTDPTHGKSHISQAKLLPAIKAEAAKYLPNAVKTVVTTGEAERSALVERRERLNEMFEMGGISKEQYASRLAAVDDELDSLQSSDRAVQTLKLLPRGVDFDLPEAEVGETLRTMWERVELDADLNVKRVVWRLPAEYHSRAARDRADEAADADVAEAQRAGV